MRWARKRRRKAALKGKAKNIGKENAIAYNRGNSKAAINNERSGMIMLIMLDNFQFSDSVFR